MLESLISDGFEANESIDIVEFSNKKNQFDNFWAAVEDLLNETYAVPDERRHGTNNVLAPCFVSLRHFHEEAQERVSQMFPDCPANRIPSLEYFR